MKVIPLAVHPEHRTTHELKCWPEKFDAINRPGGARATCRRVDDRTIETGDRIVFVLAAANGAVLGPREEIDAIVTRVECMAGDRQLYGASSTVGPKGERDLVPFALIHFRVPALDGNQLGARGIA
jgi:hypothetical protein